MTLGPDRKPSPAEIKLCRTETAPADGVAQRPIDGKPAATSSQMPAAQGPASPQNPSASAAGLSLFDPAPQSRTRRTVTGLLAGPGGQLLRLLDHSGLGYLLYRYRYLAGFTVIGFLSILLELWMMRHVLPSDWSLTTQSTVAFCVGIVISFVLNAFLNFQVTWRHLLRTFTWFVVISTISFALNMAVVRCVYGFTGEHYHRLRLLSAGALFVVGYTLHRRFTFNEARDFGLAVYACEAEDPQRLYQLVGRNCDHVHVDLIDETMSASAPAVRLENIAIARSLWRRCPLVLHIMSLKPREWMQRTWHLVDWYLFHLEADDNLFDLIIACRQQNKRVGVVWRPGLPAAMLLPYLPHVDIVMVLGIREPGKSGQQICPEAIELTSTLNRLRARYGYEMMFDGGVKASNISQIEAKYVVAASAVLNAERPIQAAHVLRSGAKYQSRSGSAA
ncbi:MAG TPA: GtrA family protein [Pirellulales bacterium]